EVPNRFRDRLRHAHVVSSQCDSRASASGAFLLFLGLRLLFHHRARGLRARHALFGIALCLGHLFDLALARAAVLAGAVMLVGALLHGAVTLAFALVVTVDLLVLRERGSAGRDGGAPSHEARDRRT